MRLESVRVDWLPRVNWRREALYLACVGMETCLLVPWYLLLRVHGVMVQQGQPAAWLAVEQTEPYPVAVTVGVVLAILVWGLRGLFALALPLGKQQTLLATLMLGSLWFALYQTLGEGQPWWSLRWLGEALYSLAYGAGRGSLALLIIGGVVILWWRGVSLAQRRFTLSGVSFAFRLGVLILIAGVAASSLYEPAWGPPFVVAYFFYSLLAVGLARVEELADMGGAVGSAFSGRWLVILALASGGIAALGWILSSFYSVEGIRQLLLWLNPLWRVLGEVGYFLLSLLARLLEPLLIFLIGLVRQGLLLFPGAESSPVEMPTLEPPPQGELSAVQMAADRVLHYGCVIVPLLLGILLVLFIFPARRRRPAGVEETRESLWSGRELLDEAADALRKGAERLQELGRMVGQYGVGQTLFAALTVRRVYAQMCRRAAERGHRRAPSQTPYEYVLDLDQAFPGCEEEIRAITAAYVQVHYGEVPASPDQWDRVLASWRRVQAAGPPAPSASPPNR